MIVPLAAGTPLYECSDCGGVLTEGGRAVHEAWHAMIMTAKFVSPSSSTVNDA